MNIDTSTTDFDKRVRSQDIGLFSNIRAQLTHNDKKSLLAIQSAARGLMSSYCYLEIGSYMGGSLQPHLLDTRCVSIYSIDKRPQWVKDERGIDILYEANTTARMLDNLSKIDSAAVAKIHAIDGDTREIAPKAIGQRPQLCFIDGEHTEDAILSDFAFCKSVLDANGAIYFHDSAIIYNGLSRIVKALALEKVRFHAYNLPDNLFVIELGDFALHDSEPIKALLIDNYTGYLAGLMLNDCYRRFANKPIFRMFHQWKARLQKWRTSRRKR